jgi:hypothetical protein
MVMLYGGKPGQSLNRLRYEAYSRMAAVASQRPQPERLPPTHQSATFHVMRAHHQAVVWKHLDTDVLDPLLWGWREDNKKLEPIMTDQAIAPDDILKLLCCNCKNGCASGKCTCRLNGLNCVPACGKCHGEGCSNSVSTIGSGDGADSDADDIENDTEEATDIQGFDMDADLFDVLYDVDLHSWVQEETVDCCAV